MTDLRYGKGRTIGPAGIGCKRAGWVSSRFHEGPDAENVEVDAEARVAEWI